MMGSVLGRISPYLVIAASAFAWACAGEGDVGPVPGGAFATIQREVFDQSCTQAACHSAATRSGGLSLVAGQSYDSLVDVPPENPAALAQGWLRVTPGSLEDSFIIHKLTGDLGPGQGSPMPLGAAPIPEQQLDLIEAWILDGAPPD
jgi:hypothetical protein